jgi:uncharacterized membrane protein YedE/YeeE
MNLSEYASPLIGGILIGVSSSLLLLLKGRVFGVSGIVAGVLIPKPGDTAWRAAAVVGLLTAGIFLSFVLPESLAVTADASILQYVIAGLLVGYGTQLGSGCTSGHGVCGISRLSPRSILATLSFMTAGILTVALMRLLGVIS